MLLVAVLLHEEESENELLIYGMNMRQVLSGVLTAIKLAYNLQVIQKYKSTYIINDSPNNMLLNKFLKKWNIERKKVFE